MEFETENERMIDLKLGPVFLLMPVLKCTDSASVILSLESLTALPLGQRHNILWSYTDASLVKTETHNGAAAFQSNAFIVFQIGLLVRDKTGRIKLLK